MRLPGWNRVAALAAVAAALVVLAPALVASDGPGAPAPARAEEGPALAAKAPDTYAVDAALEVAAAGVAVGRSVDHAVADPRTTLAPQTRVAVDSDDVAPVDLPVDVDLAAGAERRAGAVASHPVGSAAVASARVAAVDLPPAAAAAAAAGFAALAGLLWFWPNLKKFAVVALYAHIGRAEALQNGVRERIFEIIKADPGVHASDLALKARVSWGTAVYHLDVLERCGMVVAHKDGRYRRYFANGAAGAKEADSVLRNARTAAVRQVVLARPGLTQRELSDAAGLSPQALHWHLVRLERVGLVRKEREGRVVRHYG